MACAKVRYYTRAEAKRSIRQARGRGAGYLREYWCPSCGFYHMTSKKPQRKAVGHE